ncbi:MAG: hypothetical protein ACRBG0_19165 [Lewinella sp.]|uniref:hypothetical protein n=1 Tax=Lewinella sp. TaxID=2004506 RepID=UPI003D6C61D9
MNRRNFLVNSAILGAASLSLPSLIPILKNNEGVKEIPKEIKDGSAVIRINGYEIDLSYCDLTIPNSFNTESEEGFELNGSSIFPFDSEALNAVHEISISASPVEFDLLTSNGDYHGFIVFVNNSYETSPNLSEWNFGAIGVGQLLITV